MDVEAEEVVVEDDTILPSELEMISAIELTKPEEAIARYESIGFFSLFFFIY